MPSMRPSQFAMQQRSDGGPFLRFEFDDHGEDLEEDDFAPPEIGGFEMEGDIEIYGVSRVYYSDVAVSENSPDWHLILKVTPDDLTIYPIFPRSGHSKYADSKYDTIKSIRITRQVCQPYAHPTDEGSVEEVLADLPTGLAKDWRYGLGFHYEYRFIALAVAELDGVEEIVLHGGRGYDDTRVQGSTYYLGIGQLELLRRGLDRLSQRHQRETAADKKLICYTGLLHRAAPGVYPPKARKLPPDVLSNLISLGSVNPQLSLKDQQQAVRLTQQNVPNLAKSEPRTLFNLKEQIELVTLGELIEVYRKMMNSNVGESRWQAFLSDNPFILDMAFGYPVKKIADQPYVGVRISAVEVANIPTS